MQRGLPQAEFRLQKKHLIYILDLAVAAALFVLTGNVYMSQRGSGLIAAEEEKRAAAEVENRRMIAEADSVMSFKQQQLAEMRADSVSWYQDYQRRRVGLEAGFSERQAISGKVFQLAEVVQDMKSRSQEAIVRAEGYDRDVQDQGERIGSLSDDSRQNEQKLDQSQRERREAAERLRQAYADRTYEPVGYLPDQSAVTVKSEVSANDRLTAVELQRILSRQRAFDLGLALGVGVGSGDRSSMKELGVLLSKPLVHRRLGLDLSAGFEQLSDETGRDQNGAFAAAGLRYSPLYKERLHFGLGARASDGQLLPYISIALGRR